MISRDNRLEELGFPLDRTSPEGLLVDAVFVDGMMIYASGQVPFDGAQLTACGKVPSHVSLEAATDAARLCAANILRAVRKRVGTLENIERIVRLAGYVNSDHDFTEQHLVINGASQLARDVFGEEGRHARTALGVAQLPLGAAVEVDMILRLRQEYTQ